MKHRTTQPGNTATLFKGLLAIAVSVAPLGAAPIQFGGGKVELLISEVSERTMRLELSPLDDQGRPRAMAPSTILVSFPVKEKLRVRELEAEKAMDVGRLRVTVAAPPLTIIVRDIDGKLVQELVFESTNSAVTFRTGAPVFGLGEGAQQFDRRGALYPMEPSWGGWNGWNIGHGSLTFNTNAFVPENIQRLHALNFKIVFHVNHAPPNLFGASIGENSASPWHIRNYWARHHDLSALGVDGWWPDDGDELPLESRLTRHRCDDDGQSLGYRDGSDPKTMWIRARWDDAARRFTLEPDERMKQWPGGQREFLVEVTGSAAQPKRVWFKGERIEVTL